jgi:uncharacterized protein with GYD domain
MGYVGNQTTTAFTSMDKQDITGNGGTSYTLSHAVANANEIEVFVNNVRQESGVAYTTSGTALNMTGNVASTDSFYVVYQGKAVGTIVPPDGSVTSAKLDTNIEVSGILSQPNKEYFQVNLTTSQNGNSDNTATVVDFGAKGTVQYDTKSNFDSSNDAYLLDSSDGVYLISFSIALGSTSNINTETLKDVAAQVEVATDGSTYTALFGSGFRVQDNTGETQGSEAISGTYIYKATTGTTKVRLVGEADTASGVNFDIKKNISDNTIDITLSATATYLSVVRIA